MSALNVINFKSKSLRQQRRIIAKRVQEVVNCAALEECSVNLSTFKRKDCDGPKEGVCHYGEYYVAQSTFENCSNEVVPPSSVEQSCNTDLSLFNEPELIDANDNNAFVPLINCSEMQGIVEQSAGDRIVPAANFLKEWSLKNNITHTALSELLSWFAATKPDITGLPLDARTLLKTPRRKLIRNMGDGSFYYFGIASNVLQLLTEHTHESVDTVHLSFNVDGLPIHKSTKESFWPILCKIKNFPKEPPFPAAIYSGPNKPPLFDYFAEFVEELGTLLTEGVELGNKIIKISCSCFCCDTPARSFIKNTKGHNAYYGCDKCLVKGEFINGRMIFLNQGSELRSDEGFASREFGDYHKGPTPLGELNIGMITQFPNDYMHSICLGVVRKLLFLWRSGSRLYRFKFDKFNLLESRIQEYKCYWPCELNRKPRSLTDLEHWKATEMRQFLLYISPTLIDILPKHIFYNFMLLKFGITILLNINLNSEYNDYADKLLRLFVSHCVKIYGKEFCVYNVHSVIHLASDAELFGSLNEANCFCFENYLSFLKGRLRKSNQSLQQVVNRIIEGKDVIDDGEIKDMAKIGVLGKPI